MYHLKEQEQKRMNNAQDEIDLRVIFKQIGVAFKQIRNSISYMLSVLLKRSILVLSFTALGLVLGYAAFYLTKPYYISSMTLVLSEIRNEFVENQLNNLSDMINEGNIVAVSEQLNIDPDAANEIIEMRFHNLDEDRIAEDSILTGSPFKIELSLYDNSLFETMEPALTNYLENNRYFSKQKRIRQREIESLISKLKDQIESIDSVKTTVASPSGPVNGFVYGQPIDPTTLYRESLTMYERQVELEAELDQLDNIEVVNGFTPRFRPTGPVLQRFLIIGGLLAFVLGVIVALVLEERKRSRLSY
ncbi:chain length determinant protein [Pontibacter pamirensis]|uniref:chain length determinant protein n=1 Tax=Pontibacter pamirensis TaxID=2562824 RepID=UPI001389A5FB|nr:chain length determinant protein [Pontibacter pamirensis]